jgi:hypothetical protein
MTHVSSKQKHQREAKIKQSLNHQGPQNHPNLSNILSNQMAYSGSDRSWRARRRRNEAKRKSKTQWSKL